MKNVELPPTGKKGEDSNFVKFYIPVHDSVDGEGRHAAKAQLLGDVLPVCDDSGQTDI